MAVSVIGGNNSLYSYTGDPGSTATKSTFGENSASKSNRDLDTATRRLTATRTPDVDKEQGHSPEEDEFHSVEEGLLSNGGAAPGLTRSRTAKRKARRKARSNTATMKPDSSKNEAEIANQSKSKNRNKNSRNRHANGHRIAQSTSIYQ